MPKLTNESEALLVKYYDFTFKKIEDIKKILADRYDTFSDKGKVQKSCLKTNRDVDKLISHISNINIPNEPHNDINKNRVNSMLAKLAEVKALSTTLSNSMNLKTVFIDGVAIGTARSTL
jgi:hypothetical protein